MNYLKGKVRKIIYENNNNYCVALFRVKETNDEELKELLNKTITVTGLILNPNLEQNYFLFGEYIYNEKFGYQYNFKNYEVETPSDEYALVEYLSSSLIKGCGEKTALKIVEVLGKDALKIIKENPLELLKVPGMTLNKKDQISNSILANQNTDEIIIKLKDLGFSLSESSKIYNNFKENTNYVLENDPYLFQTVVDFDKIDGIFLKNHSANEKVRVKACLLETLKRISFKTGNTYYLYEEVITNLYKEFALPIEENIFQELIAEDKIICEAEKYYLQEYYEMENDIAENLYLINRFKFKGYENLTQKVQNLETMSTIKYNSEQKSAITTALNNRLTIISGGPGTGKTTLVNAIVKLYTMLNNLNPLDVYQSIALIAPTGRASKKLALSTGLPAMTIHRYLKWNKDTDSFGINEFNKNPHKLIIVDEVSMIDITLFSALLKGIGSNIQLILVGDVFQLPSVGPGLILADLINSEKFSFCPLQKIYRQNDESYIPYLAKEIKENKISANLYEKKVDYNFLNCEEDNLKKNITKVCEISREKGLTEDEIQILAPLYKGANGIDLLNQRIRDIFNPLTNQREIKIGEITFREKDKVLQLVNNPDANVFNGDIGRIEKISPSLINPKKDSITINFEGTRVEYSKAEMKDITHAYVITIHKSQGSEFPHVIIPLCKSYRRMLYNKLLYTAVSRAKKSLVIIGKKEILEYAIQNDYANNRQTTLKEKIEYNFE